MARCRHGTDSSTRSWTSLHRRVSEVRDDLDLGPPECASGHGSSDADRRRPGQPVSGDRRVHVLQGPQGEGLHRQEDRRQPWKADHREDAVARTGDRQDLEALPGGKDHLRAARPSGDDQQHAPEWPGIRHRVSLGSSEVDQDLRQDEWILERPQGRREGRHGAV